MYLTKLKFFCQKQKWPIRKGVKTSIQAILNGKTINEFSSFPCESELVISAYYLNIKEFQIFFPSQFTMAKLSLAKITGIQK